MKTIKLKPGMLGRYDDVSPFVIAENLDLQFDGLLAANGDYYVIAELNDYRYRARLKNRLTISQENLTAGELKINVQYFLRGVKIAEYTVEPLMIKELDVELSAEPAIAALTAQTERLEKNDERLKQTLTDENKRLQGEINALATLVTELTKRVDLIEGGYDPLQI